MGHNYPSYPYLGIGNLGIGMIVAFTISLSFPFAYLRYKTRTVFGPCVIHGMINGTAALFLFTITGAHELLGSIVGVAGIAAGLAITFLIALFDREFIRRYSFSDNTRLLNKRTNEQPQTAQGKK